MSNYEIAQQLIGCLDLTSLNTDDNDEKIINLCRKAHSPYGDTAAVCVFSQFVPLARKELKKTNIKVASVVNFPHGNNDFKLLKEETKKTIGNGADEIDVVFPYREFLGGNTADCRKFLEIMQRECSKHTLKIILETGAFPHISQIATATKMCLEYEVDFIKTSTGKTEISATIGAANIILETLRDSGTDIGFKASGGIRTFDEAYKYFTLAQIIVGKDKTDAEHFRIGASSLIDDLIKIIEEGK